MFIKAAAIAFTIATTAGGTFFGLTMSGGHRSQLAVAPRSAAEAAGGYTGNRPPVTVAVTKQRPTPPYPGDMAVTGAGEAITVMQQTLPPALRQVPARTPVYLTIRVGVPPPPSSCYDPCTIGTTYIVRLAGHTILRAVYPSHAFLGLPPLGEVTILSRRYTFPHPGVYRFVGRFSVGGVTSRASIRVRVTG